MLGKALAVGFFFAGSLVAQTTVTVRDSSGNEATAAICNGNLFYHDSKGNSAIGTVRSGNVFLNTSEAETVVGTIQNGNVFLTDKKGITTGTIHNGNVFLNNSDGSVTSGTYDKRGNVYTNTTSPAIEPAPPSDTEAQQRIAQQQQQAYDTGYAVGYGLTSVLTTEIRAASTRHKLNSYCKANPTSVYQAKDGVRTPCQQAPITEVAQNSINNLCTNHPYVKISYGLRIVTCDIDTAPDPPNLAWTVWLMNQLRAESKENKDPQKRKEKAELFNEGAGIYCQLTGVGAKFNDVQGHEQGCK